MHRATNGFRPSTREGSVLTCRSPPGSHDFIRGLSTNLCHLFENRFDICHKGTSRCKPDRQAPERAKMRPLHPTHAHTRLPNLIEYGGHTGCRCRKIIRAECILASSTGQKHVQHCKCRSRFARASDEFAWSWCCTRVNPL